MERYYQIARCYRDEDFRADRQPEFTQLDIEMSFVEQDDVIELGEAVVARDLGAHRRRAARRPFQRMTYAEAMARYGSDKPDLRFGNELVECTDYFADTTFRVFQAEYVGAVVMPGGASQPRKQLDAWQEWAKQRGARGLAYVLVAGRRRARRPGRQEPLRRRAGRAGRARRREARRLRLLRRRRHEGRRARCSGRPGSRSAGAATSSTRPPGASSGSSTRRSSSRPPTPSPRVTSPSAPARGRPCTTPSPRRSPSSSTPSTPTRARRSPTPTTSSATATRSAAARSVSTAATCRSASSR